MDINWNLKCVSSTEVQGERREEKEKVLPNKLAYGRKQIDIIQKEKEKIN